MKQICTHCPSDSHWGTQAFLVQAEAHAVSQRYFLGPLDPQEVCLYCWQPDKRGILKKDDT